jgi:peptidoglycan-associated lipoprotein
MGTVLSLLALTVVAAGCAKRPATTQVVAPAPGAGTGATRSAAAGGQSNPLGGGGAGGTAPGTATDGSGTTQPTARPVPRDFTSVPDLMDIHFDFDKYDIRPGDARTLDTNAAWLKQNGNALLLIEGHCDERGTNEYNLALGERRAKAAMNYLVAQGVQGNRITIISYGEERPVCQEKSEECWGQNRRAHFLVKPR